MKTTALGRHSVVMATVSCPLLPDSVVGFRLGLVVEKETLGQIFLRVLPCQYYSTCAPYSSSCYSYQKDKRPKPDNLPKAMHFRKFMITYSDRYLDIKMWKGRQADWATQLCMVAPNICWSSVWNLFPVTLLVPRGGL
jgi:hypothetical protein